MKAVWAIVAALALTTPIPQLRTLNKTPVQNAFAGIEEALGLPSLANGHQGPDEVRVMQQFWSAAAPQPRSLVRVVRDGDARIRAEFFLYWEPSPLFPTNTSGSRCLSAPAHPRFCVRGYEPTEQMDWERLLSPRTEVCPQRPGIITVCGDCDSLWFKMFRSGQYREDYCNGVVSGTLAADLYELLSREAKIAARDAW